MEEKRNIEKGIQEFNETRFPEAFAKLVKADSSGLAVEFGGTTCSSCSFSGAFY